MTLSWCFAKEEERGFEGAAKVKPDAAEAAPWPWDAVLLMACSDQPPA